MSREHRNFHFQVKATGTTTNAQGQEFGQITAYGAVFSNVDDGNDCILPGAFKRTIKNSKERAMSRQKNYILPCLWQHDTNEVIGGWYEITEDTFGLLCKGDIALATQRGREYYELAKAGMTDQFSIVYDVPQGGATYNKSGVRELSEIRLFSVDVVTFAMNDETKLVGVKSITGSTSLPIGPRNESWDSSKAEKQIWSYATKSDGTLDAGKLRTCFMVQEGDPQKKGSWSYPYVYIKNGNPMICVGAVIAIAGLLMGARGADAPEGLKPKVATIYARVNKLYPDDPKLTPPWEESGKAQRRRMQRKDFNDEYRTRRIQDWLDGWYSLQCALYRAIMDAFDVGDDPQGDTLASLNGVDDSIGFIAAVQAWVQEGIALDYSNYLDMQQQQSSSYGYMSQDADGLQRKTGAMISAANQAHIDNHVANLKSLIAAHAKAMRSEADDFASIMQGAEPTYAAPNEGTPDEQEGKATSYTRTRRTLKHSSQSGDTVEEQDLTSALATLHALSH